MTKHAVNELGDTWHTAKTEIAFSIGKGTGKELNVFTRFDGNCNAVVRFVVTDRNGKEIQYEKFDAAVAAYNRLP